MFLAEVNMDTDYEQVFHPLTTKVAYSHLTFILNVLTLKCNFSTRQMNLVSDNINVYT